MCTPVSSPTSVQWWMRQEVGYEQQTDTGPLNKWKKKRARMRHTGREKPDLSVRQQVGPAANPRLQTQTYFTEWLAPHHGCDGLSFRTILTGACFKDVYHQHIILYNPKILQCHVYWYYNVKHSLKNLLDFPEENASFLLVGPNNAVLRVPYADDWCPT